MSVKTKRFLKKMVSWLGLFFFAFAAYMLYNQLSKYSWVDIKSALLSIPKKNLMYACIASFLGYVALSSYDYLALRYIGRKLTPWKWIFAGFIGFQSAIMPDMPLFRAVQSVIVCIRAGVFMLRKLSKW